MCGRFTLAISPELLAQHFALDLVPRLAPRFNIAPSQDVLTVRLDGDRRVATPLRWGLMQADDFYKRRRSKTRSYSQYLAQDTSLCSFAPGKLTSPTISRSILSL